MLYVSTRSNGSFLGVLLTAFVTCSGTCSSGQAIGQPAPQAVTSQAAAAFVHSASFSSITLTGTAVHGATSGQAGTVTLVARVDGSGSETINIGDYVEIEQYPPYPAPADCLATPNEAPAKESNPRRCLGSTLWFLPQMALLLQGQNDQKLLSELDPDDSNRLTLYRRHEARSKFNPEEMKKRTSSTLVLDPATSLINRNLFQVSPIERPRLFIPMTVVFSDYFSSGGVTVPGRIQRYVYGTLQLDIRITTVQLQP